MTKIAKILVLMMVLTTVFATAAAAHPQTQKDDTTPPDTTITRGPENQAWINDNTPTWKFKSNERSSTFECRVSYGAVGPWEPCRSPYTAQPVADGSWYMFWVRATDASGNVELEPATRDFAVDTTAPTTTIHGPFDSSGIEKDVVNENDVSFSLSGDNATFECNLQGPLQGPSGSSQWEPCRRNGTNEGTSIPNYADLADGDYVLSVRGTDVAGNTEDPPPSRAFTVATQ